MSCAIKIVSVVNDFSVYDQAVRGNAFLANYEFFPYDNNRDNIGIADRYNSFIDEKLGDEDCWVIFCHQDFGFEEDPLPVLNNLDKNGIYGPVGINLKWCFKFWPPKLFRKKITEGRFKQGHNNSDFVEMGNFLEFPKPVLACDCCCLMVHSSLLREHGLRFDPACEFHLYAEDFQLSAKRKYGIVTKVVQFKCYHLGIGNYSDPRFFSTLDYLKRKHKLRKLFSTNPYC